MNVFVRVTVTGGPDSANQRRAASGGGGGAGDVHPPGRPRGGGHLSPPAEHPGNLRQGAAD
eukprot:9446817-Pyramimonas_sp.AAC.1